jgi:hypothetical protein
VRRLVEIFYTYYPKHSENRIKEGLIKILSKITAIIFAFICVEALFNKTITLNQKRPKLEAFHQRIKDK